MKTIQIILTLSAFCFCGASASENSKPGAPHVALCIYSPTCIVRDKPIDVVVEVVNTGTAPTTVFEGVELELVVPPDPKLPPMADTTVRPPPDGTVRVTLNCHVPAGSMIQLIAPRKMAPHQFNNVVVAPGHSAFIKVPLPLSAFEVGECALEAISEEGAAKSQTFKINCVSLPGGGNKAFQQ